MLPNLQEWFEFNDLKSKKYNKSIWIPLRTSRDIVKEKSYGDAGYKNEFFGLSSIVFPKIKKDEIINLIWDDISLDSNNKGYIENDEYIQSDRYTRYLDMEGFYPVLVQYFNSLEPNQWHVHQDIIFSLNLLREDDIWLSPNEGYQEVIRLKRDSNGIPNLIEMKAEYLKDYLNARDMGLYLSMYSTRDCIFEDKKNISFVSEKNQQYRYCGFESEICEGGFFGDSISVFHASRNDVNDNDDLPDISGIPTDENITSKSWTKEATGRKLYRYVSDIWKTEWVEPAFKSIRIRDDKILSTIYFIIDEQGNKENKDTLKESAKWLWFKPDVISTLLDYRGSNLNWYSKDTGKIGCSPDYNVHFGVNGLGLVNVFAKDIALLPDWQQQVWSGFSITPEGGVSKELLASQVDAIPADTKAPEAFLYEGLQALNKVSRDKLGISIFKEHEYIPQLLHKLHRFRATSKEGLFELAKDVARITADSFDSQSIQAIVIPSKGEKWGSLKSVEKLLTEKIEVEFARKITAPLVGTYELRLADAHLPSSKISEAYNLIGIDSTQPYIHQAHHMLHQCVTSIFTIIDIIQKWDKLNKGSEK